MKSDQRGPYLHPDHDWWRDEMGKTMCQGCGEQRLVQTITDARGIEAFCQVCSRHWWVEKKVG